MSPQRRIPRRKYSSYNQEDSKKAHYRHHIKQKSTKEANRQKTLIAYGITRQKQSKQQHKTTNNIPSSFQQQLQFDSALKDNYHFGDKLNRLKESNLRIFYLNINGLESDLNKLTQLCLNLCSKGVSIICITETNLHWKKNYLLQRFKTILKKTWPSNKISFCVSESKIQFQSDFKPGGTAMIALNPISSAITSKGQDPWGMGRWTNLTILGKDLQQTSIFNVYRACNTPIESAGSTTIVKQQWLLMQKTNRQQHPHKATIDDLIIEIKKKQKSKHEIIITMDGNEEFTSSKGGIAKLCRECKIYDVFSQRFKNNKLPNTHIKGLKRIDYILCSFNISKSINSSGMTAFGELVTSDHRGLYIDLPIESISKPHQPDINQHF